MRILLCDNESPLNGAEQVQKEYDGRGECSRESDSIVEDTKKEVKAQRNQINQEDLWERTLSWQSILLDLTEGRYGSQFHVKLGPWSRDSTDRGNLSGLS
jgi:hypothetical protein